MERRRWAMRRAELCGKRLGNQLSVYDRLYLSKMKLGLCRGKIRIPGVSRKTKRLGHATYRNRVLYACAAAACFRFAHPRCTTELLYIASATISKSER
jgi:hypothetical protein